MPLLTTEIDSTAVNTSQLRPGSGSWIHVVSHLDPRYGGLSAAVPQLASAVAAYSGEGARISAFCSPDEIEPKLPNGINATRWPIGRMAWLWDRKLRERFEQQLDTTSGVHVHGIWEQSTAVGASASRRSGKPYVLSAHGMLDSWAINSKRMKKAVYAALTERQNVRRATCLHALTRTEAEDYRRFGATQPIAVIPNGVSIPEIRDRELFFQRFPSLRDKRIVLFLSRLHFKKGVDLLSQAWGEISKLHPDAHLVLAGPDFEGTQGSIERSLVEQGVAQSVTFTGMLDQTAKWSALSAAECFVLPSYSEGLSVAILEAMGSGLPVIITQQCNLPEVAQSGAGWTIEPNARQLALALNEMLSNSEAANRSIGAYGRRLVENDYSWPLVGRKMSEVYAWVLGGALPTSVELRRN